MAGAATQPDEVFNAARRLSEPTARSAYLDQACGDNANLRQQVEALLAAYEEANSFLESPAVALSGITELQLGVTTGPSTTRPGEAPGSVIGRYKLLEQIGEGGFGVVFMAEQTHPVRRTVALKVLKPGMDTRQVIARFEAERQALAIMDHENIAKVFDGGVTDAGHPYFVMELVRGETITEYCDRNLLPPRQRLALFGQVCHSVQHAHQKGVIHRDLKPSNVLVTVHDTTPVVKVIDFGIAKALGHELTEHTLFTGFAQLLGTPLYMSPEQAGQSGLDIDTRSDIYALGVLLYELLTGTTPFDKERFKRAAQEEIRRIIREEEPPRPSTRLSESKERLSSISAQRHTEPAKLTKLVRGELDWIVMRCLEKDRNRRYETANGLAMDLRRYLANEPVQACPPSARYRLRKFTSRYRVPLAVAAGFLLLLVGSTVVSTWQAIRIRAEQQNTLAQKVEADKQRRLAETERAAAVTAEQKAITEARKSEQVAAFMTDMLKGVGPSVALGRDTTMLREILETTTKRLDQLKGQPLVEADLRTVLGRVYYDLGDYKASETMHRAALAIRRELLGNKHSAVASTIVLLAESLRKAAQYDDAERLFREGLAMQRELLGESHPEVGVTLFNLGMLHIRTQRAAEAEALLREADAIFRQNPGRKNVPTVSGQLSLALMHQGKYADAELLARETLAKERKLTPHGSPLVAYALYNLGTLLRNQGRHVESEPPLRESLEIRLKQLPPGHIDTLWSMHNLAAALIDCGRSAEAVPHIDELARISESKGALREHVAYLIGRRFRHFQGRRDHAGCRTSAELWERLNRTSPDDFYKAACFRAATAALIRATDNSPEAAKRADEQVDRAMAWLVKAADAGYADAVQIRQNADLNELRGRKDFPKLLAQVEASALASERDAVRLDPQNADYHLLGTTLKRQKKLKEAEAAFREAIRLKPDTTTSSRISLSQLLMEQDRLAEAEVEAREVLRLKPKDATGISQLGNVLLRQQKWPEAAAAYREALALRREQLPPGDPGILYSMYGLASSLIACDRGKDAVPLIDEFVRLAAEKTGFEQQVARLIVARLRHFQNVRDAAGCLTSAEMWEGLNRTDATFLFDAACFRAVTAAVITATDGSSEAANVAAAEADRAMMWLGKSVATGQSESARARQDPDLEVLRKRRDFQELLAGSEAGGLADLSRAIERNPKDVKAYLARAAFLGRAGRIRDAMTDFDKATEVDPSNLTAWYDAATVGLSVGDLERYRHACGQLLERAEKRGDAQFADWAAKMSVLAPDSVPDFARVERMADRCVTGTEQHRFRRWFVLTKGLTEYRAGRHAQAIEWLGQLALRADGIHCDATGFAAMAMAHHRLGNTTAARASLDAARGIVAKKRPAMGDDAWRDWLHAEILCREAEQMR